MFRGLFRRPAQFEHFFFFFFENFSTNLACFENHAKLEESAGFTRLELNVDHCGRGKQGSNLPESKCLSPLEFYSLLIRLFQFTSWGKFICVCVWTGMNDLFCGRLAVLPILLCAYFMWNCYVSSQ